jgi:acetyl esterase/lipase
MPEENCWAGRIVTMLSCHLRICHRLIATRYQASADQLAGLPRALVITAENDVLRDEGEAYGRKLSEAGVETVVTRYKGAIHDFVLLNRIAKAAPVRAALLEATEFLKSALA